MRVADPRAAPSMSKLGPVPDNQRVVLPTGVGLSATLTGSGNGPFVLLNPGMSMSQTSWELTELIAPLVDAGFRVLSYTARGVTGSDAPPPPYDIPSMADDAAGLLDHFDIDRAILVGYSMGCYITQALLERRPGTALGVVMWAGLGSSEISNFVNEMELGLFERYGELPKEVSAFETMLTTLDRASLQDQATVRGWRDLLVHRPSSWASPDGHHGQLAASQSWVLAGEPTAARLAAIDVPTLVMAYSEDLFFPPATSRAAAALIPDAQFVEIDGFAHGGFMLDPSHTAPGHIVDFCRRVRDGAR